MNFIGVWEAISESDAIFQTISISKYEGQLIRNAQSGISRKRDHVFKQTKVGSKVQYFSYKLTYLFFDIVALSFNTFFPNVKKVCACRQWRSQEFFVWSTTSQLASLHHLRWNESPWDPSWGEERNGNRLTPSQGCRADGREPQTSASPEQSNMHGTHPEQTFV